MNLQTHNPVLRFNKSMSKIRESLSAAVFFGESLWVASDETTSVERLSTQDGFSFEQHQSFALEGLISLPASQTQFDQEIDVEGMDVADSFLWLTGSHSTKRNKIESTDEESDVKLIKKLAKTEKDGNRFIISRLPIVQTEDKGQVIVGTDPNNLERRAASLPGDTSDDALTDALREAEDGKGDVHLAQFLNIPGKDNGFDIEGLAVAADKVFVGLRGPVLRGWAVILELSFTSHHSLLQLENFTASDRPYRKHFLQLGGLGVRDLCVIGQDLLVLAGPTMALDGPTTIYRWPNALRETGDSIVRANQLRSVLETPFGLGTDHAEGMALVPGTQKPVQMLIVYDSPGDQRKVGAAGVRADVFDLPDT